MSIDIGGWKGFTANDLCDCSKSREDYDEYETSAHDFYCQTEEIADRANAILAEKLSKAPVVYQMRDDDGDAVTEWANHTHLRCATHQALLVCIQPLIDAAENPEGGM